MFWPKSAWWCHRYFDCFNKSLPSNWDTETRQQVSLQRDNAQHPIGQLAREAHRAIHELSVELIGEKSLEEASERVKEALFALESVNYTTRYLIPIYKWLLVLLHSASLSVIDVSKFHDTLKVIFPFIGPYCWYITYAQSTITAYIYHYHYPNVT